MTRSSGSTWNTRKARSSKIGLFVWFEAAPKGCGLLLLGVAAMRRVMIVGQPGSGKSTLARLMGLRTGLPVVHIDHIHWMPGWQERPRAEKTRMCHAVEAQAAWIFEGGHSATWANRLSRADMLIWLDVPLWRRFGRVVWRTIAWHGQSRPDLPEKCPEGFHRETLPFWRFMWRTRKTSRAGLQRLWDSVPADKGRVRLRTLADVRGFVAGLAFVWPAPTIANDDGTDPAHGNEG